MSKRLPPAGLLIAALLVSSCQGRPPVRAPAPGPAPLVTALPDAQDRRAQVRGSAALVVRLPASIPAPGSGATPDALPPATPGQAAGTAGPEAPRAAAASVPAAPTTPSAVAAPAAPSAAAKPLANAATLMALGRGAFLLPEDFRIGPLGDDHGGPTDQAQALQTAGRFLADLTAGTVSKNLLAETARDPVSATLGFELERGNKPKTYRLGRPRTRDDGEVTAAVRLLGDQSSAEGEIYLSPAGSGWLVSDFQLNLEQLARKAEKPKEKFFPLEYRWLLED